MPTWPYEYNYVKMLAFLRTELHRTISYCCEKQTFPKTRKYAFTIIIYKKGDKKVPSNFRPITLQSVFAKMYSSLIRNRIYKYILENNYIQAKIQKGFFERYIWCYWAYWIINLHNKPRKEKNNVKLYNSLGLAECISLKLIIAKH